MRRIIATLAAIAAAAGVVGTPVQAARPSGEERLAKLLEGRVAGDPRDCIPRHVSDRMTVLDKTAVVYGSGETIWVNRTAYPSDIDDDDIMIVRKFGSSNLCRVDQVTTSDRLSGMFTGSLFLSDFVPYRKVD